MPASHRVVEAVWRIESARVIARLVRLVGDVGLAEDLAQDALVAAMEQWPGSGVPDNPGAWLTAIAKNRAIDQLRRRTRFDDKAVALRDTLESTRRDQVAAIEAAADDPIGDDVLRLLFVACHPALGVDSRVALTLRLLGGLTTEEIARAFLVAEPTVAQRIVRAKRTLAEAGAAFEVPDRDGISERLGSVLEVVYLVFNEGYAATRGDDWIRPSLCEEALRLGRILAALAPAEPEVHGLVALIELQASRLRARVGPGGAAIPLLDQDRARWDRILILRGLAALRRAEALGGADGPYTLQASIAACHARARTAADTDWVGIADRYDRLARVAPSAVVELNRGVAHGYAFGPEVGLARVEAVADELEGYHHFFAVRGDLLERLGRHDEARAAFAEAASMTRNTREREALLARAARLDEKKVDPDVEPGVARSTHG